MSEILTGAGTGAWLLAASWAFWIDGDNGASAGFWVLIAAGAILGGLGILIDYAGHKKKPTTRRRRASHTK